MDFLVEAAAILEPTTMVETTMDAAMLETTTMIETTAAALGAAAIGEQMGAAAIETGTPIATMLEPEATTKPSLDDALFALAEIAENAMLMETDNGPELIWGVRRTRSGYTPPAHVRKTCSFSTHVTTPSEAATTSGPAASDDEDYEVPEDAAEEEEDEDEEAAAAGAAVASTSKAGGAAAAAAAASGSKKKRKLNKLSSKLQKVQAGKRQKTSRFNGVSFYKRTEKWECYIWCNEKKVEELKFSLNKLATDIWVAPSDIPRKPSVKKGKQIYIGASDNERAAAMLFDRACILLGGNLKKLNFPMETYETELPLWQDLDTVGKIKMLRALSRDNREDLDSQYKDFVQRFKGHPRWKPKDSRYQGVYKPKDRPKKFVAVLRVNKQSVHLGTTESEIEAAKLWDRAALGLLGKEATLNLPQDYSEEAQSREASKMWQTLDRKDLIDYVKRLATGTPEDMPITSSPEEEAEAEALAAAEDADVAQTLLDFPQYASALREKIV